MYYNPEQSICSHHPVPRRLTRGEELRSVVTIRRDLLE